MQRRLLLATAAALPLARPAAAEPQAGSVLRFIPAADLDTPDPGASASPEARDHALLVFDTLFGTDDAGQPHPQMLQTFATSANGLEWRLFLRGGLAFHTLAPVVAADCAASIRRWAAHDDWGRALMAATADLSAPDDRTVVFRLRYPFPMLRHALGKSGPRLCAMLPAKLAATEPGTALPEIIGSGPYRYLAKQRQPGKRTVYERFAPYVPRIAKAEGTAGAKEAIIERIEWTVIADPAAAAAALHQGEADWWHVPPAAALAGLAADTALRTRVLRPHGMVAALRPNHLHPPFDRPAIRRALLAAVSQAEYMRALNGPDGPEWHDGVGIFPPSSPWASPAKPDPTGPRDPAALRKDLAAAGYGGEKLVLLARADHAGEMALARVTQALLTRLGMASDLVALDSAACAARLARTDPPAQGGWSLHHALIPASEQADPVGHALLRGTGRGAAPGWPTDARMEAMISNWILAPSDDWRQRICAEMQRRALDQVPYVPLGLYLAPTAYRADLKGMLDGPPLFWNLRRG